MTFRICSGGQNGFRSDIRTTSITIEADEKQSGIRPCFAWAQSVIRYFDSSDLGFSRETNTITAEAVCSLFANQNPLLASNNHKSNTQRLAAAIKSF